MTPGTLDALLIIGLGLVAVGLACWRQKLEATYQTTEDHPC